MEKFARDLYIAKDVIFTFAIAGSAFLCFLALFVLRIPGLVKALVWTAALATPALIAVGGGFCYMLGRGELDLNTPEYLQDEGRMRAIEITGYVLWGIAGLLVCMLIFLRKRINLGVGITKAAAHAVTDIPLSQFYPFVQMAGYIILIVVWCSVLICLNSIQDQQLQVEQIGDWNIEAVTFQSAEAVKYLNWFMIFVLFWTSEYIIAMGQLTMAMCFSKWYFTAEKGTGSSPSLLGSMCITFLKHSGTAAFGALLIAICKLIRSILMWVHKKLKESGMNNPVIDAVMCCCQCCLCCVERCLKFINKNAYIQTALFGYSFCKAAREAFFLVLRNAARMFAVGIVSELAIVLCKLFIVFGCGVSSFFTLGYIYKDLITSILGVTIFISIVSWFVGNMFIEVLGIAVATILQCFIADEEMFPEGSPYVPDELGSFLQQLK